MRDAGYWMRDAGCGMLDTGYRKVGAGGDAGFWMPAGLQGAGYWELGCETLDFGFWMRDVLDRGDVEV
jgi:hypothetical protein